MAEKITVKSGIEPKSRKEPKSVQHNCNHQHKTQQSFRFLNMDDYRYWAEPPSTQKSRRVANVL